MKKLFSLIAATLCALSISASTDVSSIDNAIYPLDAKGQVGGTATITIKLKSNVPLANFQFKAIKGLPEGVTYKSGTTPLSGYGVADGNTFVVSTTSDANFFDAGTYTLAQLTYNVSEDVALGDYEINIPSSYIGSSVEGSSVAVNDAMTATLHIQRAAVIEPMGNDYALEVIPFALESSSASSELAVNMTNKDEVAYISFDLEYPANITPTKGTRAFNKPTVNTDRLTNGGEVTPLSAKVPTLVSGTTYHYELTNDEVDTYAANGSGLALTLPITCSSLTDGVYTFKMTNISVKSTTDYTTFTDHTGDYYFSVFVGTPTETDPVVYGHYTIDAIGNLAMANTNFASIDMQATTIDEEAEMILSLKGMFEEKLIYGPEKTSYKREVAGYGTVCLPFELTSGNGAQYYTVESANANSITFKAASTVAANTPAIVKGTVNASADGYQYASKAGTADAVNGLTLTGTYATFELASGDGYYISNDAFYGDGATVAPFRAYFAGSVSASKLSILIDDATGLHEITDQLSNEDIYNLQGIKLNKANKGVNIIGGKKVLVK